MTALIYLPDVVFTNEQDGAGCEMLTEVGALYRFTHDITIATGVEVSEAGNIHFMFCSSAARLGKIRKKERMWSCLWSIGGDFKIIPSRAWIEVPAPHTRWVALLRGYVRPHKHVELTMDSLDFIAVPEDEQYDLQTRHGIPVCERILNKCA